VFANEGVVVSLVKSVPSMTSHFLCQRSLLHSFSEMQYIMGKWPRY
jgi:hypothetical protein